MIKHIWEIEISKVDSFWNETFSKNKCVAKTICLVIQWSFQLDLNVQHDTILDTVPLDN